MRFASWSGTGWWVHRASSYPHGWREHGEPVPELRTAAIVNVARSSPGERLTRRKPFPMDSFSCPWPQKSRSGRSRGFEREIQKAGGAEAGYIPGSSQRRGGLMTRNLVPQVRWRSFHLGRPVGSCQTPPPNPPKPKKVTRVAVAGEASRDESRCRSVWPKGTVSGFHSVQGSTRRKGERNQVPSRPW